METTAKGPILLVAAVVVKDGRVLITRHDDAKSWHLPDGQVRFGESTFDCLRRSLSADLGLAQAEIALIEFQPVYVSETIRLPMERHYVTIHYRVGLVDHDKLTPRPGLEIERVTPSKALGMPIFDTTRATLIYMGFTQQNG